MTRLNIRPAHEFRDFLGPARGQLSQLFAAGPPPQTVVDWLRSSEAAGLKTAILDAWKSLIGPGLAVAQSAGGLPAGLIAVSEFTQRVTSLCEFSKDFPTQADVEQIIQNINNFQPLTDAIVSAVESRVEELAQIHDAAWSSAPLKSNIKLSSYELRAYLYHLSHASLNDYSRNPSNFEARAIALEPWATIEKKRKYRPRTELQDAFTAAGSSLKQKIDTMNLLISAEDVLGNIPVSNDIPILWKGDGTALTDEAHVILTSVVESYREALDQVLSFLSSSGTLPQATAGRVIAESDLPIYYDRWIDSFARLLEGEMKQKESIGDNLLVLRLTKRPGRYQEVPQRSPEQELEPEPKAQIWPGHPTRRTEAYVLEPVPERYWRHHHPSLYLREDYALSLRHRGYGIGQNIYSMSLLPEEEQTIIMKSFKDTKTKVTESTAENIFEEEGSETATDFANEVATENQRETNEQDEFNISAKASGGFLFASAALETGYNTQSSEKDFAKNTSNVTQKLAQKFSAKRTVTMDVKRTREMEETLHSEISTERKFKNPNMGHTVTFHWFQMTRKFNQELTLEDIKLVYTSGKHNVVRIFSKNGMMPNLGNQYRDLQDKVAEMPPEVARRMPPNSYVVVVTEPYTEVVSMAGANAFLAQVFKPHKAVELNSVIWQIIGFGDPAPEGLGVAAYPAHIRNEGNWNYYAPLFNRNPSQPGDKANPSHVAADRIVVEQVGASYLEIVPAEPIYLPNLDLRYQLRDGLIPSRYTAELHNPYSLPRLLMSEERIVNTNGVFCDAMVGQCTALEDYLQRHRDLDLLEKKIQVGQQEIEFKWALAKDDLVEIFEDKDKSLVAVVKEGTESFKKRIEVESAKLAEQKAIAEGMFEKQKLEKELELLNERVNEFKRKIELMGTPPEVKIDAPEGADVAVKASVNLGQQSAEPHSGTVTVE